MTRRSLAAIVYACMVAVAYIIIGALGAFSDFAPLPGIAAWLFVVDPYVLLHFIHICTPPHPCIIGDIAEGFYLNTMPVEFATHSRFVLFLGIVGLVATLVGGNIRKITLPALATLATLTTIVNWLAYASVAGWQSPASTLDFWLPIISTFWLATYWLTVKDLFAEQPESTNR
jgi:hypothetical protein